MVDFGQINADSWLESKSANNIFIPRDYDYINYKIKLNSEIIKLNSGIAWISHSDNKLTIGDLFGNDYEAILLDLVSFAKMNGFSVIFFNSSLESLSNVLVEKFGFIHKGYNPMIINNLDNNIPNECLLVTSGDFDTF